MPPKQWGFHRLNNSEISWEHLMTHKLFHFTLTNKLWIYFLHILHPANLISIFWKCLKEIPSRWNKLISLGISLLKTSTLNLTINQVLVNFKKELQINSLKTLTMEDKTDKIHMADKLVKMEDRMGQTDQQDKVGQATITAQIIKDGLVTMFRAIKAGIIREDRWDNKEINGKVVWALLQVMAEMFMFLQECQSLLILVQIFITLQKFNLLKTYHLLT